MILIPRKVLLTIRIWISLTCARFEAIFWHDTLWLALCPFRYYYYWVLSFDLPIYLVGVGCLLFLSAMGRKRLDFGSGGKLVSCSFILFSLFFIFCLSLWCIRWRLFIGGVGNCFSWCRGCITSLYCRYSSAFSCLVWPVVFLAYRRAPLMFRSVFESPFL